MIGKIRAWLLIKIANGEPVILNVQFTAGISVGHDSGLYCYNVSIKSSGDKPAFELTR